MSRAALPVVALLLLAGCAQQDPRAEVRRQTAVVLQAAADGDADALRTGLDDLVQAAEQLPADERDRVVALARSAAAKADLVDADLQARLAAEAEAERARQELEAAQAQLAEQQAREAAAREEADRGKGGDKGEKDEDEEDDD